MVLLIGEDDLRKANLTPEEAIEAVESAYRQDGKGLAQDTPRVEVNVKGKGLPHGFSGTQSVGQGLAYLEESKVVFILSRFDFQPSWCKFTTHLIDPSDGKTIAVIVQGLERRRDGYIGYRTGAAAAIGAKYLARDNINTVGVIGTGQQGTASLICVSKVREFDRILVHSGRRRNEEFANKMSRMLGVDVVTTDGPEEVVKKADVLITATPATEPFVKGEWIRKGTHISAIGADGPLKAELDADTFKRANKIVIDSDKCLKVGEIANPMKQGILGLEDIYGKIGEVVAGVKPGREDNVEITIFESEGTNIQTASIAWKIYKKAKEMGLGIETSKLSSFFLNFK